MATTAKKTRRYLSQSDVPSCDLEQAMRVARALTDEYGKQPTRPLLVASAMGLAPKSSRFRMICGASIAYGFTSGGYQAQAIELTALGRRVVAPTEEGDDVKAMREAVRRPRVLNEFLTRYDGSPLPSEKIAINVLEDMGVPDDRAGNTYRLIVESARRVGYIRDIKGSAYVDLALDDVGGGMASGAPDGDRRRMPSQEQSKSKTTEAVQEAQPSGNLQMAVPHVGQIGLPEVRLNLEIRIDASVTPDQIDHVFASMAKHLYRVNDEGQ